MIEPHAWAAKIDNGVCDEPGCERRATFRVHIDRPFVNDLITVGLVGKFCGLHAGRRVHDLNAEATQ